MKIERPPLRSLLLVAVTMSLGAMAAGASGPEAAPAPSPDRDRRVVVQRTPAAEAPIAVRVIRRDGEDVAVWVDEDGEPALAPLMQLKRTWLGVALTDLTPELRGHFGAPEDHGVMISKVVEDSPAATAGLKVGDILLEIGDTPIHHDVDAIRAIASHDKGETVDLQVVRGARTLSVQATLGERERTRLDVAPFLWHDGEGRRRRLIPAPPGAPGAPAPPEALEAPKVDRVIEIHRRDVERALKQVEEQLQSEEFQQRIQDAARLSQQMEQRAQEMERRLQELERELQRLERQVERRENRGRQQER